MTGNTIYHLRFKSGGDHYFGGIAAIFELFDAKTLGIGKQSLYDYRVTPDRPYSNKICEIKKGEVRRKKGNRKHPKTE